MRLNIIVGLIKKNMLSTSNRNAVNGEQYEKPRNILCSA